MSIKNVTVADLALIELIRHGRTDAPAEVLAEMERRGFLTIDRGKPSLTTSGIRRAEALKPCEQSLRAMAFNAAAGRSPIAAVPGPSPVRMGGGGATIRT